MDFINTNLQRDKYATAQTVFKGDTGYYSAVLNTVAENDGESVYEIRVNRGKLKTVSNPQTPESFKNTKLALGKFI